MFQAKFLFVKVHSLAISNMVSNGKIFFLRYEHINYLKIHKVCILQRVSEQDYVCDIKELSDYKTNISLS